MLKHFSKGTFSYMLIIGQWFRGVCHFWGNPYLNNTVVWLSFFTGSENMLYGGDVINVQV